MCIGPLQPIAKKAGVLPALKTSSVDATVPITGETKKTNDPKKPLDKKVRSQTGFGNIRGKIRTRGMSGTVNDLRIPL